MRILIPLLFAMVNEKLHSTARLRHSDRQSKDFFDSGVFFHV